MTKPKTKTWPELTRRQRREVREHIREEVRWAMLGDNYCHEPVWAEALRAALRQLREPKKGSR